MSKTNRNYCTFADCEEPKDKALTPPHPNVQ